MIHQFSQFLGRFFAHRAIADAGRPPSAGRHYRRTELAEGGVTPPPEQVAAVFIPPRLGAGPAAQ